VFKANNNQVEYEALIVRILLAKEMEIPRLMVKCDSMLVVVKLEENFMLRIHNWPGIWNLLMSLLRVLLLLSRYMSLGSKTVQ